MPGVGRVADAIWSIRHPLAPVFDNVVFVRDANLPNRLRPIVRQASPPSGAVGR
jgi:hypothetical protein